jgi:hypothetical protein
MGSRLPASQYHGDEYPVFTHHHTHVQKWDILQLLCIATQVFNEFWAKLLILDFF